MKLKDLKIYFICLVLSIFSVFALSCSRLTTNNTVPAQQNKIVFQTLKIELEPGEVITINASLENANFTPTTVNWTVDKGELVNVTSNTVTYSAPDEQGTVNVLVTMSGSTITVTGSIALKVVNSANLTPSTPKKFDVIAADNSLKLSWEINADENIGGYYIYYSTNPDRYDHVRDVGYVSSYTLTGLDNNVDYYVAISAYNVAKKVSSPLTSKTSRTPVDIVKPGKPTVFVITVNSDNTVTLTWKNSKDADFVGVQVKRKRYDFPSNKDEGDLIYNGNLTSFADVTIETGVEYFYSIFAYDEVPLYSDPATRSVIIIPSSNIN